MPSGGEQHVEPHGEQEERFALLLDMQRALHLAALPSDLVEERVRDMAAGLGIDAETFTLQSIAATEIRANGVRRVEIRRIPVDAGWNLRRLGELVELARSVSARRVDVAHARATMADISSRPKYFPRWLVVLAYGVYGAAVAARVGGAWRDMLVAGLLGIIAGGIHLETRASQAVALQKSFLAALAGTLFASVMGFVLPPFDAGRAVFGGVTLLVPAMVVTIGLHELANDAVESGVARLAFGLTGFLMLAFGIAAALQLTRLIAPLPAAGVTATPLPRVDVLLAVAVGGLALVVCLQGRRRDTLWIIGAAVLAYGTQEATKALFGGRGSPFVAAFVLGAVAYLHARRHGQFAATLIIPGLLQLAPGFLGTAAVLNLLRRGSAGSDTTFFDVLMVSLQLGTGLLVAGLIFRRPRASHA